MRSARWRVKYSGIICIFAQAGIALLSIRLFSAWRVLMYPFLQSLQCAWQCREMLGQLLRNGYCTLCLTKLPHCPWWGVIQFCLKLSWDSISVCSKRDEFQGKSLIHINSWIGTNKKDVLQWLNLDVSLGFLLPSAFPGCSQDLVLEASRQLCQSGGSSRRRKITFGKAARVCVCQQEQSRPDHWVFVFLFWLCVKTHWFGQTEEISWSLCSSENLLLPQQTTVEVNKVMSPYRELIFWGIKLYPALMNMLKSFPLAQRCACMCQVKYPE